MLSTHYKSDRIASLSLLNPVGLTGDWIPALTAAAAGRLVGPGLDRLRAADAAIQPGMPTAADPAALSEYAAAIYPAWFHAMELASLFAPPTSRSVTGAAVSARLRREGYDWRHLVGPIPVPTLLLHGVADLIPFTVAEATAGTLGAKAHLRLIPEAGHNPFWEQPSIVFSSIEDFLDAAERPSAP